MTPYYRIDLNDFSPLPKTLSVADFVNHNATAIETEIHSPDRPDYFPFVVVSGGKVRKFEGAYLSPCTKALYNLIRAGLNDLTGNTPS
jgi:hypothetical protein